MTSLTPFQRHLGFFDRDKDGLIRFGDSLRGNLALGLNFPLSVTLSAVLHLLYGNSGTLLLDVEIEKVRSKRSMLRDLQVQQTSYNRTDLLLAVDSWTQKANAMALWALAADKNDHVTASDVKKYQDGELLPALERRRRDRSDVLPFHRGGPIYVTGHSNLVYSLYGVRVYQEKNPD